MTKFIDDPTTTDIDDRQVSIEGDYIGPTSACLVFDLSRPLILTNDPRVEKRRGERGN